MQTSPSASAPPPDRDRWSGRRITVMAGGVGAAKFLRGLVIAAPDAEITAIVNVADDFVLHGLSISPDLDTVTYTLAGAVNPETGWGRADESWSVMGELERYGGQTWFSLGDRDLALHLYRTQRTTEGAQLSTITREVAAAWDIDVAIVPVSDDRIATRILVGDEGEIDFQDYFVARRHDVVCTGVRFEGADRSTPAPGVLDAIADADLVVIAPSNPIVSIGPLLAVPGVRDALNARRDRVVAISPIIGGKALKGPADRMLTELGHEASAVGIASMYRELAATLVIDNDDRELAPAVEARGIGVAVHDTIMSDPQRAAAVAANVLASAPEH